MHDSEDGRERNQVGPGMGGVEYGCDYGVREGIRLEVPIGAITLRLSSRRISDRIVCGRLASARDKSGRLPDFGGSVRRQSCISNFRGRHEPACRQNQTILNRRFRRT